MYIYWRLEFNPVKRKSRVKPFWSEPDFANKVGWTYFKKSWSRSQNSGWDMVWWYVDMFSDWITGLGRTPGSMVNMISFSPAPDDSNDDEGDNMTLGIRWCLLPPWFMRESGWRVPVSNGLDLGIGKGADEETGRGDADTGGDGAVVTAVVFQSYPGFTIRLIMSPSLILLYSLRSFPSASAFPLYKSRCLSAGGAKGSAPSCVFIAEIVSVNLTLIVKVACGLSDLNTRETAEAKKIKCDHQNVYTPTRRKFATRYRKWNEPDDKDPDNWSWGSRSGGGGTAIYWFINWRE